MRGRADKVYCSDRCRYADWAEGFGDRRDIKPCWYCGVPSDTIDHIPPRKIRDFLVERKMTQYPFVELWACRECNLLLGARTIWDVHRRKAFIKKALKRKYRRYLNIPPWSDAEISRLGPGLQPVVLHGLAMREHGSIVTASDQ
jgi:5-methylcytosine-specific restriction endonuclease McrA